MKKLLSLLLCGLLILSMTACAEKPDDTNNQNQSSDDDYFISFVDNATVNKFIMDFNDYGTMQILGTTAGAEPGQYILSINDCEVTARSLEHGLYLSIRGGNNDVAKKRVVNLFRYIARVADSSCSVTQLDNAVKEMEAQGNTIRDYRVSNYVKLLAYTPLSTEASVKVNCQVEMLLMNYLPMPEQE